VERALSRRCERVELRRGWPPGQVKARRFVIYDVFDPPSIRPEEHSIFIKGAVEKPIEVPLLRLALDYPCVDLVADFHCVTGWSIEGVTWRGTPLRVLLEEARPLGRHGLAWGADGYSAYLPPEALFDEYTIIAWAMNGELIPLKHGAPARLVAPTRYAWKSVKYFKGLEVLEAPAPGYWEALGYSMSGDPWREERLGPPMRGRRASL
jgi:DMSO/TMAO reductase YedYZ molybdopterin-dependent catalytic subunit